MEQSKFDLAIGVALIPLLGTGLVLSNQFGRLLYYGIPPEMLELDAYKVMVSGGSMLLLGLALIYTAATIHNLAGDRWWERLAANIGFATVLTSAFWVKDLRWAQPISWAIVLLVVATGAVFYNVERWLRRNAPASPQERIAGWAMVAFLTSLFLLAATFFLGAISERDRTMFPFIGQTNDAVVAKSGDLLIIKHYDPNKHEFDRSNTTLLVVDGRLDLEERVLPRNGQATQVR
jgi:hypothetical protein